MPAGRAHIRVLIRHSSALRTSLGLSHYVHGVGLIQRTSRSDSHRRFLASQLVIYCKNGAMSRISQLNLAPKIGYDKMSAETLSPLLNLSLSHVSVLKPAEESVGIFGAQQNFARLDTVL